LRQSASEVRDPTERSKAGGVTSLGWELERRWLFGGWRSVESGHALEDVPVGCQNKILGGVNS